MKNQSAIKFTFLLILFLIIHSNSFSQLNGTYTIGAGGDYVTITSAVNNLVSSGVNGQVVFNIKPGSYRERITLDSIPGASSLNTITFQSQTGNRDDVLWNDSVNFTSALVTINRADYITFKNISFRNGDSLATQYAFYFQGTCNNINIINNSIVCISRESNGIYYDDALTKDLIIQDNLINARTGINLSGTIKSTGTKILKNQIQRYEGIKISKHDSLYIEENDINVNAIDQYNPNPGFYYYNARGIILQNCNEYLKINRNKIISDGEPRYLRSFGIEIQNSNCQNSLIANNFVYYVEAGGLFVSNSNNINIYFNTIRDLGDQLSISSANLSLTSCTNCNVKNNIIGGIDITRIYYSSNTSLSSDFNTFTPSNFIIPVLFYYNGNEYTDIEDYRIASNNDFNSLVNTVSFVSNTDLHLSGVSIGDENLKGTPIAGVTDDIDWDPRDAVYPYMGADEADIVLPVELNTFSSAVTGNNVLLKWKTSSEVNNSGFYIERSALGSSSVNSWQSIGFVNGNGSENLPKDYDFKDNNLNSGKYKYRLKQVDFNGSHQYFNLSNEVVIGVPGKFSLLQNFPNPFNPSTVISYELPFSSFVSLKIYDLSGKEIAVLINGKQDEGYYSVQFYGSDFSSGVYFYKLQTENFIETKRMTLIK